MIIAVHTEQKHYFLMMSVTMIATWYNAGVVSKDTAHPFMFTETNFRSVTSSELPAGIHQKQQMMNFTKCYVPTTFLIVGI